MLLGEFSDILQVEPETEKEEPKKGPDKKTESK